MGTATVRDVVVPNLAALVPRGKYVSFAEAMSEDDLCQGLIAAARFHGSFSSEPVVTAASYGRDHDSDCVLENTTFPVIEFQHVFGHLERVQWGLHGVYSIVQSQRHPDRPLVYSVVQLQRLYPLPVERFGPNPADLGPELDPQQPGFVAGFRQRLEADPASSWAAMLTVQLVWNLLWFFGEIGVRVWPIHATRETFPGARTSSTRSDASAIVSATDTLVSALHAPRLRRLCSR